MDSEMLAPTFIELLVKSQQTLGIAESLTGGLVAATLTSVPGASAVFRGGVVAYQPDVKSALLQVSEHEISRGVVSEEVALQMAQGVRHLLSADFGLACTGVAGPGDHDGVPHGTVWIAGASKMHHSTKLLRIDGDRAEVRKMTVIHILALGSAMVRDHATT